MSCLLDLACEIVRWERTNHWTRMSRAVTVVMLATLVGSTSRSSSDAQTPALVWSPSASRERQSPRPSRATFWAGIALPRRVNSVLWFIPPRMVQQFTRSRLEVVWLVMSFLAIWLSVWMTWIPGPTRPSKSWKWWRRATSINAKSPYCTLNRNPKRSRGAHNKPKRGTKLFDYIVHRSR